MRILDYPAGPIPSKGACACLCGVASPLLASMDMNRFLKYWRLSGRGEMFRAHAVSYAGGFVILSRGHAAEAPAWTKAVMTKLGLTINEAKTSLKDARKEQARARLPCAPA